MLGFMEEKDKEDKHNSFENIMLVFRVFHFYGNIELDRLNLDEIKSLSIV